MGSKSKAIKRRMRKEAEARKPYTVTMIPPQPLKKDPWWAQVVAWIKGRFCVR